MVTNNLYVNDPVPQGKGHGQAYFAVGTGLQAKIDSVSAGTLTINYSDKISTAPILSVGGQIGISKQTT